MRHLLTARKNWKAYEESLPKAGYISPDTGNYVRRHCPLSCFSDVVNSSAQKMNWVPFTQFKTDLTNNALPSYSFVTPNLCNDAHDCSLNTADTWLKANINPLIQTSTFQSGGLLIIVFDESSPNDNSHGGGHVGWVAISPKYSKSGYKSAKLYQRQNTLRLMLEGLGVKTYPGSAKSASNMSEFFK